MGDDRTALGKSGEDLACRELRQRGYEILARRYRRRGGELDIVARDGRTIVFIEVKTRRGAAFGAGVDAITPLKQRRIVLLARDYLARHRLLDAPCRFDVVTIDGREGAAVIDVIRHAFDATEY